ncbi:hypothetical protein [Hyphomicrobium sp.]|uniref:hypothetical protein n=1 Tax=Hyphomicrobium sp. TaxID=82 RepID=UPI001E01C8AF|nr:hypothetical protein [Hyphomicrobium sp.]MBY0559589.1 hypothetical protein [Hyphomicrobium sp.]
MDDLALARSLHVIAVLFWVGGVGFVTWVVMPTLKATEAPEDRLRRFQQLEARFALQARLWVVLAGASGLWLVMRADLWSRFLDMRFWWMHLMVGLWAIFALMLFVIEPLHLHRSLAVSTSPEGDFLRMMRLHQLLLAVSIITIFGAVGGSHGLF